MGGLKTLEKETNYHKGLKNNRDFGQKECTCRKGSIYHNWRSDRTLFNGR